MQLCGCLILLLLLHFAVSSEPEFWGAADHSPAYLNYLKVNSSTRNLAIFFDEASQIETVFLSEEENCRKEIMETQIGSRSSNWIDIKIQPLDPLPTEPMTLFVCTIPLAHKVYHRAILFDPSDNNQKLYIIAYVVCICLSFLFSGLNLALLSLDVETLEMIKNYDDDPKLRKCAEDIIPIRQDTNLMICTIILGNNLVNIISTLVFGRLTDEIDMLGWLKKIVLVGGPTVVLLVFGEIAPQIICTKYALQIGSKLKMVMHFFTFLMWPISKPLSWALNALVGSEKTKSATVREIVRFAGRKDKMAMIANNTLELRKKRAKDVMTPLSQVKMLSDQDIINNNLRMTAKMGHTRMPVCKGGDQSNIIGVLNVKDLLLLDESEFITVGTILQLWPRESSCRFVPGETPVPQLMMTLRNNATMVIVTEFIHSEMKNVPTGIVTLEDLLEEIIGEIYDEKDRQKMTGDEKELRKQKKSVQKLWRQREKKACRRLEKSDLDALGRIATAQQKSQLGYWERQGEDQKS